MSSEGCPEITEVDQGTDNQDEYNTKNKYPQYGYDTIYADIKKDEHQDDKEHHKEYHDSHECNNDNIDPPQYDNHYTPQEHDMDPIEKSMETKNTLHKLSG